MATAAAVTGMAAEPATPEATSTSTSVFASNCRPLAASRQAVLLFSVPHGAYRFEQEDERADRSRCRSSGRGSQHYRACALLLTLPVQAAIIQ